VMAAPFLPIIIDHSHCYEVSLPTAAKHQLQQILSRLFPFVAEGNGSPECVGNAKKNLNSCHERGLVHSYWAANAWAIYLCADRGLAFLAKRSNFLSFFLRSSANDYVSPSAGIVARVTTAVLPPIPPFVSVFLTFLAIVPALFATALGTKTPTTSMFRNDLFERSLVHTALSAFVFGWHVHEKVDVHLGLNIFLVFSFTSFIRPSWLLSYR
jgi:hypothetical protein